MTHPRSEKQCAECGVQLEIRNKSGLCRRHAAGSALMHSPQIHAKISKSHRDRLMADPEARDAAIRRMREAQALPGAREARRAAVLRDRTWEIGSLHLTPEVRKRAGRSISRTRLAWCPSELRDEYLHLTTVKRLRAAEAREIILRQHEAEMRRFRKSIGAA